MQTVISDSDMRERRRLTALDRYQILDTDREEAFDEVARLAADICETPIAVVNFITDRRQFFKAEVGLGVRETPFDSSFCAKAILEQDFLLVPDATKDSRFDCNPLVTSAPHLRFYAGALLKTTDDLPLGTVCVLDYRPRELTELQQRTLRILAKQIMAQLDLRRIVRSEREAYQRAEEEKTRYLAVFESATDYGIVVTDKEGVIIDWNTGAAEILGWKKEEAVGQHVSVFFTPEDRDLKIAEAEMAAALVRGRGVDERWHIRKNGERFWANGQMMPLKSDGNAVDGFVKILRDRTSQRLALERLEFLDERLKLSLSASEGVGLWDWMLDTDLLHGDENFARMYGLDIDEVAAGVSMEGYQRHVLSEDIPNLRHTLKEVFENDAEFEVEYRIAVPGDNVRWVECKGKVIRAEGKRPRFSGTAVDITRRKRAEEQKDLLMLELAHRVKNTLAVVQGIISQTLRTAPDLKQASTALSSRLVALANAHDILLRGSCTRASLRSLVEGASRLHGQGMEDRFSITGTDVIVGPKAALSFALVLHELGTNAVKYGALSRSNGRVDVAWHIQNEQLHFRWQETDGPPVAPPARTGFGSSLIRKSLASNIGANIELNFVPTGVVLSLTAALPSLQEA